MGIAIAIIVFAFLAKGSSSGPGGGAGGAPPKPAPAAGIGPSTREKFKAGLESAVGGIGGAAVCTYFGAAAAAPLCAKAGQAIAPYATALGNWTTQKTVDLSVKSTELAAAGVAKVTQLSTYAPDALARGTDRAWDKLGTLGPAGVVLKGGLLPLKVTADVGAKAAHVVASGAGALSSGVKSAGNAVSSGVRKVLGWI